LSVVREKPAALDKDAAWVLVTRCRWYELALRRHGFTTERLMGLSQKVALEGLRKRGATLGSRFEDLVSRLTIVGLQASLRYDPEREHLSYGRNGGKPFGSYVSDLMEKRIDDYFRSKAEGFGDRRYGNDGRIQLSAAVEEDGDPEIVFDKALAERRLQEWEAAARLSAMSLADFVVMSVNIAANQQLGRGRGVAP